MERRGAQASSQLPCHGKLGWDGKRGGVESLKQKKGIPRTRDNKGVIAQEVGNIRVPVSLKRKVIHSSGERHIRNRRKGVRGP